MATLLDNEMYGLRGKALSIPEVTAIQASMTVLAERYKSKVQFWGKILGVQNDYYVAEVLSGDKGLFGTPSVYYSVDGGVNWIALAALTQDQIDFCEQLRGRFLGLPDFQYKIRRDVPPEPEVAPELPTEEARGDEDEDQDEAAEEEKEEGEAEGQQEAVPEEEAAEGEEKAAKKNKPKFQIISMPEVCRVAHFVMVHNKNCRIVPRGAFVIKQPDYTITKNRTFRGLDVDNACKLSSYLHIASTAIEDLSKNRSVYGPTFNASTDFLVPVVEDRPEGVWSLQYDASLGAVSLENLLFEGSLFYIKLGSTEFGQVYFGSGERNLDLCFALP